MKENRKHLFQNYWLYACAWSLKIHIHAMYGSTDISLGFDWGQSKYSTFKGVASLCQLLAGWFTVASRLCAETFQECCRFCVFFAHVLHHLAGTQGEYLGTSGIEVPLAITNIHAGYTRYFVQKVVHVVGCSWENEKRHMLPLPPSKNWLTHSKHKIIPW